MSILIGLSGKKRTGKDTVASILQLSKSNFLIDAFAKPLKESCEAIFGFSDEQLYGDLKEVVDPYWGATPRDIMQKFGTECGRVFDRQLWVRSFVKRYRAMTAHYTGEMGNVVVVDVRFPNEAEIIKQLGGQVWRINRTLPPTEFDGHESETALDGYQGFAWVLDNNGPLEELNRQVDHICASM